MNEICVYTWFCVNIKLRNIKFRFTIFLSNDKTTQVFRFHNIAFTTEYYLLKFNIKKQIISMLM